MKERSSEYKLLSNAFYYGDDIPEGLVEAVSVIRDYLEEVFSSAIT